jgi:hypothetical protein
MRRERSIWFGGSIFLLSPFVVFVGEANVTSADLRVQAEKAGVGSE